MVELFWLRTREELYYRMYRYWVKFFAVNFGVGVVTGIVLEFEFGTNFARFSQAVGNVISPLLAFEVMTAFFLESGFLGIMLFGWKRVSRQVHFLATVLVAAGTVISSFWILAANSWMQTPAGHTLVGDKFLVTDFHAVIFNPSTLVRMAHMTMAGLETSVFVVAGVSAYYLLKEKDRNLFRRCPGHRARHGRPVRAAPGLPGRPERQGRGQTSARETGCHGVALGNEHPGRRALRDHCPARS